MNEVFFDGKGTYTDWNLIMKPKNRPLPSPKTTFVAIEGRDGDLDLTTSLTGDVKYNNVSFDLEFTLMDIRENWEDKLYEITTYLQGKKMKVIFSDDPEWYYVGRMTIDGITNSRNIGTIVINCNFEPYRLKASETVINEPIEANKVITLPNSRKWVIPTITTLQESVLPITSTSKTIDGVKFTTNDDAITINGTATNDLEYEISNENITLAKGVEYNLEKSTFEETKLGNDLHIPYGIESELKSLTIYGESKQETSIIGKNLTPSSTDKWVSGHYQQDGTLQDYPSRIRLDYMLEVKQGTTYYFNTFNDEYFFIVREYDKNGNFLNTIGGIPNDSSRTTWGNTKYLGISIGKVDLSEDVTYDDYVTMLNDGSIRPFICLDDETDKTYTEFVPNSPSVDYPSDIESVSDDKTIEIVNCGKNLFNLKEWFQLTQKNHCTATLIENGFTLDFTAGVDAYVGNVTINVGDYVGGNERKALIKVKPSTTYTLSLSSSAKSFVGKYNENFASIGYNQVRFDSDNKYTFTTEQAQHYLSLRFGIESADYTSYTFTNIQLEEGKDKTDYEVYKGKGSSITLNEPLRSLPNGTCDTYENGIITRNIGSVVFDGSETWAKSEGADGYYRFLLSNYIPKYVGSVAMNDRLTQRLNQGHGEYEYIWLNPSYNDVYVQLSVTRLETGELSEFKEWLSNNPITLIYQLKNPTTETVEQPIISLFDGINNIFNSVGANMTLTYLRGINYKLYSNNTEIYSGVGGIFSFNENKTITKAVISMLKDETINNLTIYPRLEVNETANVNFTFENKQFVLSGAMKTPDIILKEGNSKIILNSGNGNIKISYREGKL